MKYAIITADDLGLSQEINKGIEEAHTSGILKTTALLMNAPFTSEGIAVARRNNDLEVGLHISIVEGISLLNRASSISDPLDYFKNHHCLHRNWKQFLKFYLAGKINFDELNEELELQFKRFLENFDTIPFVNGTQHLHLLPGVWKIIKTLCIKYGVKGVRLPGLSMPNALWLNKRLPFLLPFQVLGEMNRQGIKRTAIASPDFVEGLQFSGKINTDTLLKILDHLKSNAVTEIVMHPGYNSQKLRNDLPWAYSFFNWEGELQALKSKTIANKFSQGNIKLLKYSEFNKVYPKY